MNGNGTILIETLKKKYNKSILIVRIDNILLEKWYNKHNFCTLDVLKKCGYKFLIALADKFTNETLETKMYYFPQYIEEGNDLARLENI
jgi:hypothetical protein